MLFKSPEFIYFFLPFSIAAWWILQRMECENDAQLLVIICSIYFYGWWDTRYVPLLIGYALINFYLGQTISKTKSKGLLIAGLVYNVFAFSISFYPHLIAGPILHYSDVMPQLRERIAFDARQFSQGLFLFAVGLFKKNVIADRIAETVDTLFAANTVLQFFESWVASVGYGLQIYFDFSGYSDMAIGIGLMFGIILPQNFNSPYQANSIADFWKRWHMTLSRFLREYVYIPLGGNRNGFAIGLIAAGLTHLREFY